VFPWLSQPIDRAIIRLACARQPKPGTFPARLPEARALLRRPDFFGGNIQVPDLRWTSPTAFEFPSPVQAPSPKLNTVYGKLYRHGPDWARRPTAILIHGWNDEYGYVMRHPYQVWRLRALGLNAAMIVLPYHFHRRPQEAGAVRDFLSEDLYSSMLAVHQAVSDIRAFVAWLEAQGCANVGLCGVSLGAWLTALAACHEERIRFATLTVPVARMDRVVKELDFAALLRHSISNHEFDFSRLNLRSHQPKPKRENILIVEAEDDLFACKEAVEELWQTWGRPEIWRYRHAHLSLLFWPPINLRVVNWVGQRANAA
jgi:pimeloyl-ACP methyl ester carboxylesterase